MGDTIRILIVEKDRIYRDGLRLLIESTLDFELVAEVDTISDAVNFSHKLNPDVIIMDDECSHLPKANVYKQVDTFPAKTQVLIFSSNENLSDMLHCLKMGVCGYLNKGKDSNQLAHTIRLVAKGNLVIDEQFHIKLKNKFENIHRYQPVQHYFSQLTPRENQIVSLLVEGLRNKEIAQSFDISEKTVRNHVSNIFSKLNVSNRMEAISYIQTTHLTN